MKRWFLAVLALPFLLAGTASAQSARDLSFEGYSHRMESGTRIFSMRVSNTSSEDVRVRGRFVAISVYDTSPPRTVILSDLLITAGETREITAAWPDAPAYGYIRGLLILTDGNAYLTEAFDAWILPYAALALILGIVAAIILFVFIRIRLSGRRRDVRSVAAQGDAQEQPAQRVHPSKIMKWPKAPSGMVAHIVGEGETVVSLSNDFGGTWQDIVKANHLKPPYTLKPGQKINVPKHELKRPEQP